MKVSMKFLTWAWINSSLLSAKRCLAIMLLRSRIHCLSPSDRPNTGREAGWKGIPLRLLSRNECKKVDRTLCGVPEILQRKQHQLDISYFMLTLSKHQNNMPINLMPLLISVSVIMGIWKSLFKLDLQHRHFFI